MCVYTFHSYIYTYLYIHNIYICISFLSVLHHFQNTVLHQILSFLLCSFGFAVTQGMSNVLVRKPYYILKFVIIIVTVGFSHPPSTALTTWSDSDENVIKAQKLDMSMTCLLSPLHTPFPRFISQLTSLRHLNLTGCAFTGELLPEFFDLVELEVLDLTSNHLSGPLLPDIARMKNLRQLILDGNQFSGRLPPAIGDLVHLEELSLRSNSFSGLLPPELGNLRVLQSLDICSNIFSGLLPPSLANLTRLQFLTARHNMLSGHLFKEIGNMKKLQILDLSWNSLNGTIPSGVGDLEELSYLNIGGNDWDGELPASIGRLRNLVYLVASNSWLKGEIPSKLGKCMKLKILDLSFNSLEGRLPEELAGLVSIHSLLLNSNRLSGPIPLWISHWTNVVSIFLTQNLFTGKLPPLKLPSLLRFDASDNMLSGELCENIRHICADDSAPRLRTLILSRNRLSGSIGGVFKNCFNLRDMILSKNNISGELPGYLGKLGLTTLEMVQNRLTGPIPDQLWESRTLMAISLSDNLLQGSLSAAVANVATLRRLQLDNNLFSGGIPSSIGKLKNLTNLSLHGNKLSGEIPSEIFDCTQLISLDLGGNRLVGEIPRSISKVELLDNLVLSNNRLTGTIPEEICSGFKEAPLPDSEFTQHYGMLDLSYNRLEGPIPSTIRNCIVVQEIQLQGNKLNGGIPEEIWSLPNLTLLDLSSNALSGLVSPPLLPQLMSLQGLILSHNQLRGSIPADIWPELPGLAKLDFSFNYLTGPLPPSLFSVKSLAYLDVSMNSLSGRLNTNISSSSSSSLLVLNVSNNQMIGEVDDTVSNLASLSMLDLHNNAFSGSLPPLLSSLDALTYLDLSGNQFQDSFPCNICSIPGLAYTSFSGNNGDFPESCKEENPCNMHDSSSSTTLSSTTSLGHHAIVIAIVVMSAAVISVIMLAGVLKWETQREEEDFIVLGKTYTKKTLMALEPVSINVATFEQSLLRLEAAEISSATENFSRSCIIGDGGFGTVYKASLPGGKKVAVKRLHGGGRSREFVAEIETIGKVKHANLVPLLGYCVFEDERFLIYEYMEKGSLDSWLRKQADGGGGVFTLDWPTRFKICLGSARGLEFLHHGFVPHIIHRDIKSSNILLDGEFEARVSDFGLARVVSACESHVSTALAGTLGYVPPEYGQAMVATTKGDVYSFGVVMLELVTGRTPTGQADGEGGNLVGWVRLMVGEGRKVEILDPCFCGVAAWRDQMLRVLAIAWSCTSDHPWIRPTMFEVVKLLEHA